MSQRQRDYQRLRHGYKVPIGSPSIRSGLQCAVCGEDSGHRRHHTKKELADHMRETLIARGYPDPWRKR